MQPSDLSALGSQNPFLQQCSQETLGTLSGRGRLLSFADNELLFRDGDPAGVILFPLSGSLQMSKTDAHERRQVICNVEPRKCNGICILLLADHGLADVHGVEPGQVLILGREEFQQLARQDQLVCQMGWQAVIECMKHLADLVESLSFHTVARRVALTLLRSTEKDGDLVRITQSELAAEVGTTREVVARCLAGLRRAGAVKLGRARITVLSREKLQQES